MATAVTIVVNQLKTLHYRKTVIFTNKKQGQLKFCKGISNKKKNFKIQEYLIPITVPT